MGHGDLPEGDDQIAIQRAYMNYHEGAVVNAPGDA
jgi:hypothetical protein